MKFLVLTGSFRKKGNTANWFTVASARLAGSIIALFFA